MKNLFEAFEDAVSKRHFPFVVYCKPGSTTVTALFQQDAENYIFNPLKEGFIFAPFSGKNKLFIPAEKATVLTSGYENSNTENKDAVTTPVDEKAKTDFEKLVAKSIAAIQEGRFEKLVCSRTEKVETGQLDVISIYKKMLSTYPDAFRYCFYSPQSGLWMGATPEQLLKAHGNTVNTVALAGTQVYKEGEEAVWEEKEKQEQQFVTDYIVENLESLTDIAQVSLPYTFRAGNLSHLKTDISATLKDASSITAIINTLHPTPAVCGLPKAEAKQFLLDNEGYDREYYSGFLGEVNKDFAYSSNDKTDLFVNLRCMKIEDTFLKLFIGCGVTIDSEPGKEFLETVNKSVTMRKLL